MIFQNELILLASVFVYFGAVVVLFKFLGKNGIYVWNIVCTIAANIEVLILVKAFSFETTLGNVLFASTFLATDILSEKYGKEESKKCVTMGIAANVVFIAVSQTWFLYVPSEFDFISPAIRQVFSVTPRIMIASLIAYAACQFFDVWMYHLIWKKTAEKSGDTARFLWLRNNGATLLSQILNAVLFNVLAFFGTYEFPVLCQIIALSFATFVVTSILDTPFLYAARKIKPRENLPAA